MKVVYIGELMSIEENGERLTNATLSIHGAGTAENLVCLIRQQITGCVHLLHENCPKQARTYCCSNLQ